MPLCEARACSFNAHSDSVELFHFFFEQENQVWNNADKKGERQRNVCNSTMTERRKRKIWSFCYTLLTHFFNNIHPRSLQLTVDFFFFLQQPFGGTQLNSRCKNVQFHSRLKLNAYRILTGNIVLWIGLLGFYFVTDCVTLNWLWVAKLNEVEPFTEREEGMKEELSEGIKWGIHVVKKE